LLTHPMLDQLTQLGLSGMAQAFTELETSGDGATLTHADWLGLLVDREVTHRRDKRLAARLRYARLRHHAVIECAANTGQLDASATDSHCRFKGYRITRVLVDFGQHNQRSALALNLINCPFGCYGAPSQVSV
jgi:IstB-like ATP binding protein